MKLALFLIPSLLLIIFAVNVADASDGVQPVYKLYAGDARDSENKPDIIAYANTEHTASPYDFTIEVSGKFWRYYQWISLTEKGSYLKATTNIVTTNVGVQLWGDQTDGWAKVSVDGSEIWRGDTYGKTGNYPGDAFACYLEISNLPLSKHTIMVEPLGINGEGGRPDVTVFFFGLKKETQESVAPAYTPVSPSISTTTTVIKGDGNGDGKISMNDALYAFQMAIGRRPVDLNLDMDGNDKVNIFDAIQLLILAVRPGKTNLPENTNISVGSSNKNTSEKTSRPIIPTGDESAKRCQPSEKTYKLGENIDAEILIKILGEKDGNCLVYEKIVKDNTPNNLVGKEMNCKICTCSTNGIVPIGDNIKEYCTGSLADAIDELYKRAKGK